MAQQGSKQTFEQFYGCTPEQAAADLASRNKQAKIAKARDAIVRATVAWVNFVDDGRSASKQQELVRIQTRMVKAVTRLEKLTGK